MADPSGLLRDPLGVAQMPSESIPPLLCQVSALLGAVAARLLVGATGEVRSADRADPQQYLTAEEVSNLLRLPKGRVYELARQGRLPTSRIGKYVRFPSRDIDRWVAERTEKIVR